MTTIVTPVYAAYLVGTPDVALSIVGGSITEDAGQAPRWQATLTVSVDEATFAALDPRLSKRVRIEVAQTEGVTTTSRTFDLALRDRDRNGASGEATLNLASDESLLIDYARITRGYNQFGDTESLRTLSEWVLKQVFTITNVIVNPSAATDTSGWSAVTTGGGTSALTRVTGVSGASVTTAFQSTATVGPPTRFGIRGDFRPAVAGTTYTARAEARVNSSAELLFYFDWYDASSASLGSSTMTVLPYPGAGQWRVLSASGVAPVGTTQMRVVIVRRSTVGTIGDYIQVTNIQMATGAYAPIVVTGTDANIAPFWEATNLMTNPSVANTADGYSAGVNATAVTRITTDGWLGTSSIRWASSAAGDAYLLCRRFPVVAGERYKMMAHTKATAGRNMRLAARFLDDEANLIREVALPNSAATGGWDTLEYYPTVPAGASQLSFCVVGVATAGAQTFLADGLMLLQIAGTETIYTNNTPYFDGGNPSTGYTASWDDAASASSSTRYPIITREPESLIWEAGQKAYDFIAPLVQAAQLRLVCNELRQWSLRPADFTLPGTLPAMEYGVNLIDSGDVISRDDDEWYDCAVVQWRWNRRGIEKSYDETYALTTPWTKTRTFQMDTPFPGTGLAQYSVQRAVGRGREASVVTQATWTASADMLMDVELEQDSSPVHCKVQAVQFDLDRNEMTTTLRTI